MDSRPGLRTTSPSSGTRTGRSNTRTLPPDPLLECAGRTRWPFGIREPDEDYPVTIIETEGFLNLVSVSAVALNQPFSLFFGAGVVLIPVRFECMRTPPVPAGRRGRVIRIVKFGIVRHLFSLLAQQVPVVQADGWIVNQNDQKNKTRRSGLSAGALRMPDTSAVARDFSPAGSLTPQVRKL
ncbi:hypothetical protein SB359474_0760 [Shigella boydii 3594-74]|uniref:Uncharacterized protein n=1 Tax=Shigella boydii 4444-74 TaxID=766140 RepID=I6EKI5_SHIBO|nr:hypothetical protein SB359474_0760 [Shigella boydii 3594-74]EIQ44527.1 hypothetical protein SB444474_0958 [Shigella boydii 4444-74]